MTIQQIYAVMRQAAFPAEVAVTMTAIALRESSGEPTAFNGNAATGDRSYGLTQINMRDVNVANLIYSKLIGFPAQSPDLDTMYPGADGNASSKRIEHEKQLFDPTVNAKAAHLLWGGNNNNLNIAWYINHGGAVQSRYESHLPAAQAAALAYHA